MWSTKREPIDLDGIDIHDDLVDTVTAAALAGVKPKDISNWRARGHLAVAARDHAGRPRYRPIDVAKAERATRTTQQSRRRA